MAKNVEEMDTQKLHEQEQRNLLKSKIDQLEMELAEKEEELKHSYNNNSYLNNELDRLIMQRDQINGIIRDVKTNKISDAMFKSNVITAMGWRR